MTVQTPAPIVQVIPATAPFSDEQRSWLNGFFAGLLSLDKIAEQFTRTFGPTERFAGKQSLQGLAHCGGGRRERLQVSILSKSAQVSAQ